MAQADFGTGKSLVVLAIVLGCFAILWPKIFYPMMQTAFAMTSPNVDRDGRFRDNPDRPPHLHPASVNPRGRGASSEDVQDKFMMREGRPFPHSQVRQPPKSQPKSGGAMGIIMPIYTVGIVVFFLYTVLKLVFKKPNEGDKKPLIKDFHMDPEYRKFVCQTTSETRPTSKLDKGAHKKQPNLSETPIPENVEETTPLLSQELDPKDFEIYKLKKKLEETEQAMERIIKHMGVVNACLNERVKLEKKIVDTQKSDVRQRHKGNNKNSNQKSRTSKKCHIQDDIDDTTSNNTVNALEEDLAELITLCNESMEAHVNPVDDQLQDDEEGARESDSDDEYTNDEADEDACAEQNGIDENKYFTVNGCCTNKACA